MEHLLVINVERRGVALATTLRTVWATTEDRLTGHRRTDTEVLVDAPALLHRLAALVPRLVPPAAAVQEGAAPMVPAADPALAAGGELHAASAGADRLSPTRLATGRARPGPRRSPTRSAASGQGSAMTCWCGPSPSAAAGTQSGS